jgi:hypothetical protein
MRKNLPAGRGKVGKGEEAYQPQIYRENAKHREIGIVK